MIWEPAPGRPLPATTRRRARDWRPSRRCSALAAGLVTADAQARGGRSAADEPSRRSRRSPHSCAPSTRRSGPWTPRRRRYLRHRRHRRPPGRRRHGDAPARCRERSRCARARRGGTRRARGLVPRSVRPEVPVRLGELTRSDDGLLGYFVDGDFTRVRLVDRAVADLAREAGRSAGTSARGAKRRTCRRSIRSCIRTCTPRTRSCSGRACRASSRC